jgi:hypothetical protein
MFSVGQTVKLTAKTKHGKDRIAQHGKLWRVKSIGKFAGLPAISLESMNKTFKNGEKWEKDWRWVKMSGEDPDFEVHLEKN